LYWEQPDLRDKLRDRIEQTAMRIYFQPRPHYIEPHVVQPGDLLQSIARGYNISWQYLAKLNRVEPQRVQAGQQLKVIQGPFGAVVDLRRFELTVHSNGYFVARFPIGIGKDGSTPVGEFTVQDKLENPTYYGPDGVVAPDDPQNPLGEFWMSLGDSYGIHGTIDESSIGRAESRGCVRLKNQDVADLYDLLTVGSPVVIRR
jgi:lipoprotein-anchoring transpeptidase ErfK/SrfK